MQYKLTQTFQYHTFQTFQYHTFQTFQYHTRGFTTIGITELPIAIYTSGIGAINIPDRTLKPEHTYNFSINNLEFYSILYTSYNRLS